MSPRAAAAMRGAKKPARRAGTKGADRNHGDEQGRKGAPSCEKVLWLGEKSACFWSEMTIPAPELFASTSKKPFCWSVLSFFAPFQAIAVKKTRQQGQKTKELTKYDSIYSPRHI